MGVSITGQRDELVIIIVIIIVEGYVSEFWRGGLVWVLNSAAQFAKWNALPCVDRLRLGRR